VPDPTTVLIPDLGDFQDVEVIEVLVKAGDIVEVESPLITLETDKATMDVPSSDAGRVAKLRVKKGDRVSKGDAILELEPEDEGGKGEVDTKKDEKKQDRKKESGGKAGDDVEVEVPDIGDFKDVEIIEVLVSEGDDIELETPLITLETEKATMDVPSSAKGTVRKLHVKKGDRISAGGRVATVRGQAGRAAAVQPEKKEDKDRKEDKEKNRDGTEKEDAAARRPKDESSKSREAQAVDAGFSRAHAGPAVRRLARELGVDLARVQGSGFKGRITDEDVKAWVKKTLQGGAPGAPGAALPRVPEVDFASFGPVEVKPLGRIQRISGARLQAAWVNLPHVTQHDEADITDLEQLRASLKDRASARGIKLTPLAFIVRACARVIAQFPNFSSSLDATGQNQVFKKYLHIGFAADTPNGLDVPVIRDAGRKDI
jgi:pyruvate dehydrogenase E2 component (dihydrolipoamide acetyltransferase)